MFYVKLKIFCGNNIYSAIKDAKQYAGMYNSSEVILVFNDIELLIEPGCNVQLKCEEYQDRFEKGLNKLNP